MTLFRNNKVQDIKVKIVQNITQTHKAYIWHKFRCVNSYPSGDCLATMSAGRTESL